MATIQLLMLTVLVTTASVTMATQITVDTSKVLHTTEDHFVSFTIDSGFFGREDRWEKFNYT